MGSTFQLSDLISNIVYTYWWNAALKTKPENLPWAVLHGFNEELSLARTNSSLVFL